VTDLKDELHRELRAARANVLAKLDDLSEYDIRRPLTATGTNLLGLVKHLTGLEYEYLGTAFGRPPAPPLPWVADGSIWDGADMWATADESSTELLDGYRAACEHASTTIDELALDAAGTVAHWPPERRDTTLGALLVRMVAETAQHAGHVDIVRELIDGTAGADGELTAAEWQAYVAQVQAAADAHRQSPAVGDLECT
jgi:uncharacterized damage-inducible protein DinB